MIAEKNKLWIWYQSKVLCSCFLYFPIRMFSEKRENWVLRDNLKHFCFWFWIWITGRVLYPVRIVEMERGTSSKGGCCELLLAYAARSCSSRLEFEILCKFFNYKGMWPSWEPRWLRSRFILTWKVRTICIILKLKRVFFRSSHVKQLIFALAMKTTS